MSSIIKKILLSFFLISLSISSFAQNCTSKFEGYDVDLDLTVNKVYAEKLYWKSGSFIRSYVGTDENNEPFFAIYLSRTIDVRSKDIFQINEGQKLVLVTDKSPTRLFAKQNMEARMATIGKVRFIVQVYSITKDQIKELSENPIKTINLEISGAENIVGKVSSQTANKVASNFMCALQDLQ